MSQLLPSGWQDWIPVVAALWLASVSLLVFSTRKYFAARALDPAGAKLAPVQEPYIDASRTTQVAVDQLAIGTDVDYAPRCIAAAHEPPAELSETISRERDAGSESLFEAVRTRIASDRTSAHGLGELIRALYLDQSNFTFQTIAELNIEDRALAKGLLDEWLVKPSAVGRWEELYEAVRESPVGYQRKPV